MKIELGLDPSMSSRAERVGERSELTGAVEGPCVPCAQAEPFSPYFANLPARRQNPLRRLDLLCREHQKIIHVILHEIVLPG